MCTQQKNTIHGTKNVHVYACSFTYMQSHLVVNIFTFCSCLVINKKIHSIVCIFLSCVKTCGVLNFLNCKTNEHQQLGHCFGEMLTPVDLNHPVDVCIHANSQVYSGPRPWPWPLVMMIADQCKWPPYECCFRSTGLMIVVIYWVT